MRRRYLFLFVWIVFFCKGQDAVRQVDSLKQALHTSQTAITRTRIPLSIVSRYVNLADYRQAMHCDSQVLALSSKIKFPKGGIEARPKCKRFKYRGFEGLLSNSHRPMNGRPSVSEAAFKDWRGGIEQVDDVLVPGFKI